MQVAIARSLRGHRRPLPHHPSNQIAVLDAVETRVLTELGVGAFLGRRFHPSPVKVTVMLNRAVPESVAVDVALAIDAIPIVVALNTGGVHGLGWILLLSPTFGVLFARTRCFTLLLISLFRPPSDCMFDRTLTVFWGFLGCNWQSDGMKKSDWSHLIYISRHHIVVRVVYKLSRAHDGWLGRP